jgi:hypothetical protein
MATGVPPGQKLEVEFTAGVWTDVTADWDAPGGPLSIHIGRADKYSQPSPGSMTFTLDNHLGKYTPQRQVLADGVTAHPYWPNVVPRKRVRYSYTISAVQYVRFLGYIKGWPPALENGVRPVVTITATDRMDQLSRVKMKSPIHEQIGQSSPFFLPQLWWPLTDAAGSTQAVQAAQAGLYPLGVANVGQAALAFGDNGPGVGDGTGVKFSPSGSSAGQFLAGNLPALDWSSYTVECWVNCASLPAWVNQQILALNSDSGMLVALYLANGIPTWQDDTVSITGDASIVDAGWHHIAVRRNSATHAVTLYVDGVLATGTATSSYAPTPARVTVGAIGGSMGAGWFQGNIGEVALYNQQLAVGNIQTHAAATNGYSGDTTDARISRYLTRAGVALAEMTLDVGKTTVGTYPQAGKDVVSACQDIATTEGGGAVFWVRPSDGDVRFPNRRYRDTTTPALTLDASVDLDASVYDPAFDETTLVNSSTASRSAESGTLSTQTYTDTVSLAAYGESDTDITTYTLSDQDALNLAQAQVAGNSQPGFRLNQIAVNLSASTNSLYVALASVEIGSRIRITNLPPGAAPLGTLDLFVEGWIETVDEGTYRWVADTSPVGTERIKLDDATYGRLGCAGQTLNASLTNSATTVVIATSGTNPTFTTVGARYPLNIKVGEEVITLNSAPGGATSPQTFTGCSRGQQGTFAAAQASGATVNLFPATALAL